MAGLTWKQEPYFSFEKNFDESWIDWCLDVWYTTFIIAAIYVALVHPAQKWMEPRQPLKLRVPLVAWNVVLGVYSIMGTVRSLPVLVNAIRFEGLHSTLCDTHYFPKDYVGIWGFLFVISKIPELGDTAFIILRKQKLIFLHWYHHASTLVFAWRMYATRSSVAFWFCCMNYFVHSLMYTYYAFRAAGFRINRKIAMCITLLQLSQMFVGMYVVVYAVYHQVYGGGCATERPDLIYGIAIYTSYMVLFAHFFYNAYMKKQRAHKSRDATVAADKRNGTKHEVNGNTGGQPLPSETVPKTNGVRRRELVGGAGDN